MRGLGSKDRDGLFTQWTKNEFKNYIYQCYFRGDLNAFTNLLHTIYEEFDISEQMFGLMTNINDLPSSVHYKMIKENGTRPSYKEVKDQIVRQLNIKTAEDYITDVDPPKDGPKNGGGDSQAVHKAAYVRYIDENDITYATTENINGTEFEIDTLGYIIYTGNAAASLLDSIKAELDTLVNDGLNADEIITHIDELLFEQYCISMLSDGFEEFYVYKHALLDTLS